MADQICLIKEDGTKKCMDVNTDLFKEASLLHRIIICLILAFIGIFIVISVMSFLSGALGFDVVSALILSALLMLYPISFMVFVYIIYLVVTKVGFADTTNIILSILIIVGIGVGAYFLYAWIATLIAPLWDAMVASW